MAKHARAVVLDKPMGTFSVQQFPLPEPAAGTVLLRMELSGCCATDAHTYLGQWKNVVFPALLGHENVGTVVATGPGGQRDYLGHDLQPGDRVSHAGVGAASATSVARCSSRGGVGIGPRPAVPRRSRFLADSPSTCT